MEIGPGDVNHLNFIKNMPKLYTLCDIDKKSLSMGQKKLESVGIRTEISLLNSNREPLLPFPNEKFDFVLSFNTFEHLYPLEQYLIEITRVLVSNGIVVGGIPCEGGVAWGLGRLLTTRRYVHKHFDINYDKIICWEHPNYADFILNQLSYHFKKKYLKLHPFNLLPIDFNIVASFIFQKKD